MIKIIQVGSCLHLNIIFVLPVERPDEVFATVLLLPGYKAATCNHSVTNLLQCSKKLCGSALELDPSVLFILYLRGGGGPVSHLSYFRHGESLNQAGVSDMTLSDYQVRHAQGKSFNLKKSLMLWERKYL